MHTPTLTKLLYFLNVFLKQFIMYQPYCFSILPKNCCQWTVSSSSCGFAVGWMKTVSVEELGWIADSEGREGIWDCSR